MASDATWKVKGLGPGVRETAREAARRSGLSVSEWLQSVILDSAAEEGVTPGGRRSSAHDQPEMRGRDQLADRDHESGSRDVCGEHDDRLGSGRGQPERYGREPASSAQAIDARLDLLSRQVERLAQVGAAASAPIERAPAEGAELTSALRAIEARLVEFGREASARAEAPSRHVANALAQLDQRLEKLLTNSCSPAKELEARIIAVDRALATLNRDVHHSGALATDHGISAAPTPPHAGFKPPAEMPLPAAAAPRSLSAAAIEHESAAVPRPTLSVQRAPAPAPRRVEVGDPVAAPGGRIGLDDAIAEIAARQQALDGEPEAPEASEQFTLRSPLTSTQADADLSSLHHQIRKLTSQLEMMRPDAFEQAIAALRGDLVEIGRKLTEAAPRRALQALEAEVRALADRLDIGRHHGGGDAAALASIERGLGEVRDALRNLAPAESLAAFSEDVRALDRKIDAVAAGGSDSAALHNLQRAVAELREIAARAASGEALVALAEEVQSLGDKIDRIVIPAAPGVDVLSNLDQRFAQLAAALEARAAAATPAEPAHLISIVQALADRIERMEFAHDSAPALDQIAAQLGRLSEKLEVSGARLAHLDAIERALSEVLDQMDGLHASARAAADRAAQQGALEGVGSASGAALAVEELKQDLGALRQSHMQSDRRTQDTLEAVHDTLERLVDRLAMVETDIRGAVRASAATLPPARPLDPPPEIPPSAQQPEQRRSAAIAGGIAPVVVAAPERRPIDPTLPADHPLEPGTAMPRTRAPTSPAARIAASEAALEAVKPVGEPESKANFIAAARRAAQAAASMASPSGEVAPAEPKSGTSTLGAIAKKLSGRRPVLIGLAILAVAGTLHLVLNVLGTSYVSRKETPAAQQAPAASAPDPAKISGLASKPASSTPAIVPPTTSSTLPPLGIVSTASRSAAAGAGEPDPLRESAGAPTHRELSPAPLAALPSTSEPAGSAPAGKPDSTTTATVSPLTIASLKLAAGDVTGSTGRAAGFSLSNAAPMPNIPVAAPATMERMPGGISPGLRAAALSGNAAAEYEIALRHAEGRGGAVNLEDAAHWFERAADRGVAPAQYRLGSLYEKGQGVKKDLEKARRLYTSAADKGNAKAMHNLAVLHADGVDGKPDYKAAAQWFRKAADRGVADSQYNLAILHARGLGVEQNLAESYKWFALAAQQGDPDAGKKRDDVASRLDQQALVAARLAVQTFTAVPQPEEATTVKPPPAGWDAPSPAAAQGKSKSAFPSRRNGSS